MPYAAIFPGCKIDGFLKKFYRFSEMRRLGGLETSMSKGSKCELFPITSPLTGMETRLLHQEGFAAADLSDHISPNGDGNFSAWKYLTMPVYFPITSPLTGMETFLKKHRFFN